MSTLSIPVEQGPSVQYLLRLGDTALILGQRLGEWCGHAPVLEEDIALANIALDHIGQARALLTRAGQLGGQGHDEDQLAFLREERDYRNATIVELPNGDFAATVLRNAMMATWFRLMWERLRESSDSELAAIAGKAVKEARYHQQHSADWVVRLGDGSEESARRMRTALDTLWRYSAELFDSDAIDSSAAANGLGPRWDSLREPWLAEMREMLDEAKLPMPADSAYLSTGKTGVHTEHMGYILSRAAVPAARISRGRVVSAAAAAHAGSRVDDAWKVLHTVLDPEVPALSVCDLGIVRDVVATKDGLEIVLTPTYSGCPATEVIEQSVVDAVNDAGLGPARVTVQRAPAWTTDWISDDGRRKLREYGIAPPSGNAAVSQERPIRLIPRQAIECPRCGSKNTERLSAFGSTACKALYRCVACREPFEHFKPI